MNRDEYNKLFHKVGLNRVAFKAVNDCDEEILVLVNAAIEAEREACVVEAEWCIQNHLEHLMPERIRERGAP